MPVTRADEYVGNIAGLRLFVREIRDSRFHAERCVLLVHGARAGGSASFDLPVPGGSFAADLAARGFRVFVMDARGYGRSDRPQAMREPADRNPPLVRINDVAMDIGSVADWIRDRTASEALALLGWATGGHCAGYFATLRPEVVSHLVLLNSLYGGVDGHPLLGRGSSLEDPARPGCFDRAGVGAWTDASEASLLRTWTSSFPSGESPDTWRDPAVAAAYARTVIEQDPDGLTRSPPAARVPTGALEDSFYLATGRQLWDASLIRADTLVVRGTRDFWARPEDDERLLAHLVDAPTAARLVLEDATHFVHLDRPERGRADLLDAVAAFLGDG